MLVQQLQHSPVFGKDPMERLPWFLIPPLFSPALLPGDRSWWYSALVPALSPVLEMVQFHFSVDSKS